MYTLWKNFGMDGKSCSTFKGVDFVLNDGSASVLARNVLFLYLCLQMPKYESKKLRREWLEWIASVWAIWYNHELAPQHNHVFTSALAQLLEWSETPTSWERCQLGKIVSFSSFTIFKQIKNVWALWAGTVEGFRVTSVRAMKKERRSYQAFQFQKSPLGKKLKVTEVMENISNWRWKHLESTYTPERVEAMIQESRAYLEEGTAYAEIVLGLELPSSHQTIVNKTFYQQADGSYSLHYELDPYIAFCHFVLYSPTEVCKMLLHGQGSIQTLPVPDKHFRATTLLANSVQQFGMWITASANILKQSNKCRVSFTFDCSEAVGFCQTLFQFPDQCWEGLGILKLPKFDAIFTSNVINSLMPGSVLVVAAAKLLKPNAALFTTTFLYTRKTTENTTNAFIERLFGLPSELLPVIFGIRCIGNDGKYSSTTTIQPTPLVHVGTEDIFLPSRITLIWKNIISHPLIIQSLTNESHFTDYLLKTCNLMVYYWSTFDAFLAIADCFTSKLNIDPRSYQFWEPLCKQIAMEPILQRLLIQMQTQSFLHGFHMHITVTEDSCPLCRGQSLVDYIGGYSLSFSVSVINKYEEPTFSLHLYCTPYDFAIITSVVGSTIDSNVQLDFFFPKEEFNKCKQFELFKNDWSVAILTGEIQRISSAPQKYQFMKYQRLTSSLPIESSMGKIVHHSGDATKFETTLSLSDECLQALEMSKLEVGNFDIVERKLELVCGKEIHMSIIYPYPIHTNVSIELSKKEKILTIFVERATHCFYNEEPTIYFDLYNPLSLPKICYDNQIVQYFNQQLLLKAVDPSGILCLKDIFQLLATHACDKHFVIEVCGKDLISAEKIMICVHSVHIDPYFESPMMSVSFCFPQSFEKLQLHIEVSWSELTNGTWSELMVVESQFKSIKQALLYFKNSTRKNLNNSEIPFVVANSSLWKYFHHALIHPLYPNTQLQHVKAEVEIFLTLAAEKRGESFHTFTSETHEKKSFSTNTELPSPPHEECANCKKTHPNLKKCGACGKVQYCCKECQRKHWKEHKSNCKRSSTAPTSTPASCGRCKKQSTLIPCSCGSVSYCSTECHSLDWPVHRGKCTSTSSARSKNTSNEANSGSIILSSTENKVRDKEEIEEGNIKPQESSAMRGSTSSLDTKQSITEICSYCKKEHSALKKCSGCGKVQYCGKECQTKHLKEHKSTCQLSSTDTSTQVSDKCTSTLSAKSKHVSNEPAEVTPFSQEQETLGSEKDKETAARSALLSAPTNKTQDEKLMCSRCKKISTTLHQCPCHKVSYCTIECQRLDWPKHKDVCKKSTSLAI